MMARRARATWAAIFQDPLRADVPWRDVENLLRHLGAHCTEGQGSRLRVQLQGRQAVFHRPHPSPLTDKGALKSVRRFLREALGTEVWP